MAYLPAIGITPDSTCAAGALSTCGRMIRRRSKCASKEMISGSPRCQSSGLTRRSISHGSAEVWRRTSDWSRPKTSSRCSRRGRGQKCNTGDRQIRCATSSSMGRWDDHVEPGGSTGTLSWRDHDGLRFSSSGAHGCRKLCWTAAATFSRTPQWRRLR